MPASAIGATFAFYLFLLVFLHVLYTEITAQDRRLSLATSHGAEVPFVYV